MSNIPKHFAPTFKANLELLLQQNQSKLSGLVENGSYTGEGARVVDQVGSIEMQDMIGRFAPMGRVEADLFSRWVYPKGFDLPQLIDTFDKLQLLVDPTSKYVENAKAAANRKKDKLIVAAFFADAQTGKDGSAVTQFLSTNTIAVNYNGTGTPANAGLSVAKLRKAKKMAMANQIDLEAEQLICVVTSEEHDDLLGELTVTSRDYNDTPVMHEGKIQRFLGIDFVHCEQLDHDASGYTRVPVFVKSGMHLGIWSDVNVSLSQRHDLQSEPYQAYLKMMMGATRLDEKKVFEIKCDITA